MAKQVEKFKTKVFHRPDWHPILSSLLGDIRGSYGYVTEIGTIALLGPNPQSTTFVPEEKTKTDETEEKVGSGEDQEKMRTPKKKTKSKKQ